MSDVILSGAFFAKIAGWEAMKLARALLQTGQVLSSNWTPPVLKGVVQEGPISYRAGLVIRDAIDLENLCTCRSSREWGTICAHSVAVGLHHLRGEQPAKALSPAAANTRPVKTASASKTPGKQLRRAADGEPLEVFVILPPNFEQAVARGKMMLCLEGKWQIGRAHV